MYSQTIQQPFTNTNISQLDYPDLVQLLSTPMNPQTRSVILERLVEMNNQLMAHQLQQPKWIQTDSSRSKIQPTEINSVQRVPRSFNDETLHRQNVHASSHINDLEIQSQRQRQRVKQTTQLPPIKKCQPPRTDPYLEEREQFQLPNTVYQDRMIPPKKLPEGSLRLSTKPNTYTPEPDIDIDEILKDIDDKSLDDKLKKLSLLKKKIVDDKKRRKKEK